VPDYRAVARQKAKKYGLDPYIFERQINAESGFRPRIGSPAGAQGIAQIMPATAASWGVNPNDPVAALDAAAKHMAQYVRKYGSYEKALRAYNAGEGAIERSKGFSETNNYVAKILFNGRDPGRLGSPSSSPTPTRPPNRPPSRSGKPATAGSPLTKTVTTVIPGTPASDNRRDVLAQYLLNRHSPNALLAAAASVKFTPAVPDKKVTQKITLPAGTPANPSPSSSPARPSAAKPGKVQGQKTGKVVLAGSADRSGVSTRKPILGFLRQIAGASGREVVVTTGTNHSQMTTSGNVSDHWAGNAADLGMNGDARQSRAVDRKGTLVAAHAIQEATALQGKRMSFEQAYAMAHAGGIHNFDTPKGRIQIIWRTDQGGNHWNHVHVGLNPGR
jgi:hypothetical protein